MEARGAMQVSFDNPVGSCLAPPSRPAPTFFRGLIMVPAKRLLSLRQRPDLPARRFALPAPGKYGRKNGLEGSFGMLGHCFAYFWVAGTTT